MPTLTRIIALLLLPFGAIVLGSTAGCGQGGSTDQRLSPTQAMEKIRSDSSLLLLDVRTPEEFSGETGHLKGAKLLPVQELEGRIAELEPFKNRPILVYCRSGSRSNRAGEILTSHGFAVMLLDGGILAWNDAGLPTEKTNGGNAE